MERKTAPLGPEQMVKVQAGLVVLEGSLTLPRGSQGVVVFAHGSGSGRHSPRNRFVAQALQREGMGTLLIDLLTPEEEEVDMMTRHLRFDVRLLADRLMGTAQWLLKQPQAAGRLLGYFGASTGAAAALIAAAEQPEVVAAVVSRGGRPDLAGPALPRVKAPTLMIVGGNDFLVIDLNKRAMDTLECEKRLEIVQGATHLFEEPGTLEEVARLAGAWFKGHLVVSRGRG